MPDRESRLVWLSLPDPAAPSFVTSRAAYLGTWQTAAALGQSVTARDIKSERLLGRREVTYAPWQYTHENLWGFAYEVRAEALTATLSYYELDGVCLRAAAYWIKGLELDTEDGRWRALHAADCWGTAGALTDTEDGAVESQVLFIDRHFDTRSELEEDMRHPRAPQYAALLDQIFADG